MLYRVSLVSHEGSAQIRSSSSVLGVLPDFSGMRPTIVGVSCVKMSLLSGPHHYPRAVRMKPPGHKISLSFRPPGVRVLLLI